jgi:hypothetical protein
MRVPVVSGWTLRQRIAAGVIVGGGLVLIVALWAINRRAELVRLGGPKWLRVDTAPDYIPEPVSPADSWASARPSHMSAACFGMGAGRRARRTYPPTLADEPSSLIRGEGHTYGGAY